MTWFLQSCSWHHKSHHWPSRSGTCLVHFAEISCQILSKCLLWISPGKLLKQGVRIFASWPSKDVFVCCSSPSTWPFAMTIMLHDASIPNLNVSMLNRSNIVDQGPSYFWSKIEGSLGATSEGPWQLGRFVGAPGSLGMIWKDVGIKTQYIILHILYV